MRFEPRRAFVPDTRAHGPAPAGFIGESYYGNTGGMPLPEGYLDAVHAAVRRHGGLAIADEIQVGYGRLGHWFRGFEQQGVVPDIIAVAKAVGNGVPVGAVITSRAVADKYRDAGYFFSSTGGSPLSSRKGGKASGSGKRNTDSGQGGTTAQKKEAGRKGGKASAEKS